MLELLEITTVLGIVFGLICALWCTLDALDSDVPPRQVITKAVLIFLGYSVSIALFPVTIVVAAVYITVSFIKNDWAWYRPLQRKNRRNQNV